MTTTLFNNITSLKIGSFMGTTNTHVRDKATPPFVMLSPKALWSLPVPSLGVVAKTRRKRVDTRWSKCLVQLSFFPDRRDRGKKRAAAAAAATAASLDRKLLASSSLWWWWSSSSFDIPDAMNHSLTHPDLYSSQLSVIYSLRQSEAMASARSKEGD